MSPILRRRRRGFLAGAMAAVLGATMLASAASAAPTVASSTKVTPQRACAAPTPRHAACMAVVNRDAGGRPLSRAEAADAGLHPFQAADLQNAYDLPSSLLGARQTIAIVAAFDDPNAEADLAVYRAANGLPPCDANFPCFRKVNQRGGDTMPPADLVWSEEMSIDLDMAAAACPNCRLLLVEADDNSLANLAEAVDQAVTMGADIVSNSYGTPEYDGEAADLGNHFNHPGTVIVAGSGEHGFGSEVPAAVPTVVAVGGTALFPDASARGWGETAWSGAGSGCSLFMAKPSWQKDRLCDKRTVADVSAVADPATPVAVYDTFLPPPDGGWIIAGGTGAATALIAGVFALAGNAKTISPGTYLNAHRGALHDVTSGSNGNCGGSYLCTAVRGYDGPTGNGTPNGIGAF